MEIPHRILRAEADAIIDHRTTWHPHQWAREATILQIALAILVRHGRHIITRKALAAAIGIAPATRRRYFCDIDALMGEILRRHLQTLADALAAIPATTPNLLADRRQAWLAASRTKTGVLTDAHKLFQRDRRMLPADILPGLEQTYQRLGALLAGQHAPEALALLGLAPTTAHNIETLLAALIQTPTATPRPLTAAPARLPAPPPNPGNPPPSPDQPRPQNPPSWRPSIRRHHPPHASCAPADRPTQRHEDS